ncbi:hypothetical protein ACHAXN_001765 [Cyclotella atomus]|jgi:hypothetical protein
MISGFSTAANWLTQITGNEPIITPSKKDLSKDPIIRDLHAMKSQEIKAGVFEMPPPKHTHQREVNRINQQPKPKFVAHKDPTKGKTRKEKVSSNRLGGEHMA